MCINVGLLYSHRRGTPFSWSKACLLHPWLIHIYLILHLSFWHCGYKSTPFCQLWLTIEHPKDLVQFVCFHSPPSPPPLLVEYWTLRVSFLWPGFSFQIWTSALSTMVDAHTCAMTWWLAMNVAARLGCSSSTIKPVGVGVTIHTVQINDWKLAWVCLSVKL